MYSADAGDATLAAAPAAKRVSFNLSIMVFLPVAKQQTAATFLRLVAREMCFAPAIFNGKFFEWTVHERETIDGLSSKNEMARIVHCT
jgi:hypothetical protein